jgi:hypothetical protein
MKYLIFAVVFLISGNVLADGGAPPYYWERPDYKRYHRQYHPEQYREPYYAGPADQYYEDPYLEAPWPPRSSYYQPYWTERGRPQYYDGPIYVEPRRRRNFNLQIGPGGLNFNFGR